MDKYIVFLDDGIQLMMQCDKGNGPHLRENDEMDGDDVGVPGKVIRVSAPADSKPHVIMRAQKIAAAFSVGEVTWTTMEPLEAALAVEPTGSKIPSHLG